MVGRGVGREVEKHPLVYLHTSYCDQKEAQSPQTAEEPSS